MSYIHGLKPPHPRAQRFAEKTGFGDFKTQIQSMSKEELSSARKDYMKIYKADLKDDGQMNGSSFAKLTGTKGQAKGDAAAFQMDTYGLDVVDDGKINGSFFYGISEFA